MPAMKNIVIKNARLLPGGFKNFSGRESDYNAKGMRNFCVVIDDPVMAEELATEGWNIRYLPPREPDDAPLPYLKVAVSFKKRPPKITVITTDGYLDLDEERVDELDYLDYYNVALVITPSYWEKGGNSGIKAYLKSICVTLEEDELASMYSDIPRITGNGPHASKA